MMMRKLYDLLFGHKQTAPRPAARRLNRKFRLEVERLETREVPAVSITEFSAGITAEFGVYGIASGSDGNLWFGEGDSIGRITPQGVVTEFSNGLSAADPNVQSITNGPDGNLWFTDSTNDRIGRITTQGVITEFAAGVIENAVPHAITAGADGNLWFLDVSPDSGNIGRITPQGVVTEFRLFLDPVSVINGGGIVAGPDGNIWFTSSGYVNRVTPEGALTSFEIGNLARHVTTGPDGNLWYTLTNNKIGRITPAGDLLGEFSSGISDNSGLWDIATGPDGNLWFTELVGNRIGRITPSGVVTEFSTGITELNGGPTEIVTGADGNLWFTQGNSIGRLSGMPVIGPNTLPAGTAGTAYNQTITVTGGTTPYTSLTVTGFNAAGTGLSAPTTNLANGTVSVSGTPTGSGTATFTVSVLDTDNNPASKSYSVTVNPAAAGITVSPSTLPAGSVGTAYNQTITVTGGTTPYTSLTVTNFDAGGTGLAAPTTNLANGTVSVSGTPTSIGMVTFTVNVVDANNTPASKDYTVTINAMTAITGHVFNDFNGDGIKNGGDTGISGLTIVIDPVAAGNDVNVVTDPDGNYTIGLVPGDYLVSATAPPGAVQSTANPPTVTVTSSTATAAPIGFFRGISIIEHSAGISASAEPDSVVMGPDGNLWFTQEAGNRIGRITPAGVVTEFTLPNANSGPRSITVGPDGNLWFTEFTANRIGRITTAGVITEFTAGSAVNSHPSGITAAGGALYFTDLTADRVSRMTTDGVVTDEYFVGIYRQGARPDRITVGPDGNLWFTEDNDRSQIGTITTGGSRFIEISLNTPVGATAQHIVAGPDGALWFTVPNRNRIGRIETSAVGDTYFVLPNAGSAPTGITVGPDGNLWFGESNGNRIGRITASGTITEYTVGLSAGAGIHGITSGPDNSLWFAEKSGNRIGQVVGVMGFNPTTLPAGRVNQSYSQTITIAGGFQPYTTLPGTEFNDGGTGLQASFNPANGTISVSGTPTSAGTATGTIKVLDANNNPASKTYSITINAPAVSQTITFGALLDREPGQQFQVSATASSGLPVTLSIVSGPATINGNTVTLTGATGQVTIRASQAGNALYSAAPDVDQVFTVGVLQQLRIDHGFYFFGSYYQNAHGFGEKWFFDRLNRYWALTPQGELVRWDGISFATSRQNNLVANLGAQVFDDPTLLFNAPASLTAAEQTQLNQLQTANGFHFVGTYQNYYGLGEKLFQDRHNGWWALTPQGELIPFDGVSFPRSNRVATLSPLVFDDLTRLFNAPMSLTAAEQTQLNQLQTANGFHFVGTYQNYYGLGEKLFQDRHNGWWALTPQGELIPFDGVSFPRSNRVATLSPLVFDDLTRLFNAPASLTAAEQTQLNQLQTANGFHFVGTYQNYYGLGEKLFQDRRNQWWALTPQGELIRWDGISFSRQNNLVATLSPLVFDDLTRLFNAQVSLTAAEQTQLNQLQTANGFHFVGTYQNYYGLGEKLFQDRRNQWWALTPQGELIRWDGISFSRQNNLVATLSPLVFDDPTRLFNAQVSLTAAEQTQLNQLQTANGFRFLGSYYQGAHGYMEKWFQDRENRWWALTHLGELIRWDGMSFATSRLNNLAATLSPLVFDNPNLLFNA